MGQVQEVTFPVAQEAGHGEDRWERWRGLRVREDQAAPKQVQEGRVPEEA
jgi:hypothetical protein